MPNNEPKNFNALLIDSVDETISGVLGSKINSELWTHYQAFLGITRDEMPYRVSTLFEFLNGTLGIAGETLGKVIVKKLYAKANIPLHYDPNRPLADYVEELRRIFDNKHMQ